MKIGIAMRNMGTQSSGEMMAQCVLAAESAGLDSIWITDHIAIPPDDAEGSGGRYTETLTTLAWLGGLTTRIAIGSGVLILPYREKLMTAKQVATIQDLTGGRLLLGVGIGWMDAEFRAVGVNRHRRGLISDATLELLNDCFANEVVSANGQEFLFKPRPVKPPVLVGGRAPHALERAARLADGWLPMARDAASLAEPIAQYRQMTSALNRPRGQVVVLTRLSLEDSDEARSQLAQYRQLGVDAVVSSVSYDSSAEFADAVGALSQFIDSSA